MTDPDPDPLSPRARRELAEAADRLADLAPLRAEAGVWCRIAASDADDPATRSVRVAAAQRCEADARALHATAQSALAELARQAMSPPDADPALTGTEGSRRQPPWSRSCSCSSSPRSSLSPRSR
jgi:hypothetical protein